MSTLKHSIADVYMFAKHIHVAFQSYKCKNIIIVLISVEPQFIIRKWASEKLSIFEYIDMSKLYVIFFFLV